MADVKISALPAASTPLAGTEVLPIVQGGTTDKVSVANLTAGRTVDAAAVSVGAGTVSAPGLTFSGDTNTGIYSPAADTIAFTEGGVEAMRLDASGRLGLGTSAPSYRFDIPATGAVAANLGGVLIGANGTDITGDIAGVAVKAAGANPVQLFTNGTEHMRIDSSGNVGIGTSSPAGRLHARFDAGAGDGFTGRYIFQTTDQRLTIGTYWQSGVGQHSRIQSANDAGAANNLLLNPDGGNVGIGVTAPNFKLQLHQSLSPVNYFQITNSSSGSGAGDGMLVGTDSAADAIVWMQENANLKFATNNTERMRIDAAGNVVAGGSVALATTATNGFLYVPTCAGVPTGTPTAITGMAPIVVNTTNNKLYFYSGGAWRDAGP